MTFPIDGTCGYYSGSPTNIVYSQTFSGDGSFCTGFMAGGSAVNSGPLQAGDILASATNNLAAFSPAGYGVFVSFTDADSVMQEYLIEPPTPSSTPTGYIQTFFMTNGVTDDGPGLGSCNEQASLTVGGTTYTDVDTAQIQIPITFGQPIPVTEAADMSCNVHSAVGFNFGDEGERSEMAGPILVYDANENLLGPATLIDVPEASTAPLAALVAMAFWLKRRRRLRRAAARAAFAFHSPALH